MKTYTTSAQKTLPLPVDNIIETLRKELEATENITFEPTKQANLLKAKMKDGSTLAIAGFKKENGLSLAMIDHENVSLGVPRELLQKKWKDKLNRLFL